MDLRYVTNAWNIHTQLQQLSGYRFTDALMQIFNLQEIEGLNKI